MVGQRVNNFQIRRLLAEGGMGAVYEAVHPTLRKKVAVKVLRPELAVDGPTVQRFFNEARAASAIRHHNIIEILGLGLLPGGVPYIVMELLEGECLSRRLAKQGPLPVGSALDLSIQIARGLEAAHGAGIVHRDLKPDNVFLVAGDQVKLLDFGIAKLLGDLSAISVDTVAGTVFGTPPYMSPEQCRGNHGEIDHRSDIYALGVILYELLCGKPPFTGAGLLDVLMMHLTTVPMAPSHHRPDIPPALERLIMRALAKDARDRFADMGQMIAALVALTAPAPSPPDRLPRADRRRLLAGAAAAGLLLLGVSAAVHFGTAERLVAPAAGPTRSRPDVTPIAAPALPPAELVAPPAQAPAPAYKRAARRRFPSAREPGPRSQRIERGAGRDFRKDSGRKGGWYFPRP
jgi:eukaryotic-like serine/threonine-protein kinase